MVKRENSNKKGRAVAFTTQFSVNEIDRFADPVTGERIVSKKFESVSRIEGDSENGCKVVLDYQNELFMIKEGDKMNLAISLSDSLMDDYSYVMFGRLFKYEQKDDKQIAMYASFGGMMMELVFPIGLIDVNEFQIDCQPYLYLSKAQ
eukprot:CFRG7317T1